MSVLQALERDLEHLRERQRFRRLDARSGFDFSSNDYLGLADSSELREAAAAALDRGLAIGSGGSRLLRGNHGEHEALEEDAARFFGSEAALFFATGFTANSALLSTLPQRGDGLFYDELIHASCHEGIRLTRAEARPVRHNDAGAFADAIRKWRSVGNRRRPWIVVESLYSMDGDRAPLAQLAEIAERHEAVLIIDEAHATGVFGRGGRGLASELEGKDNVITVRTCGKALGCEGALVCGPQVVRSFLINRARGFIFSTAPSPLMAALVRASLLLIQDDDRRERLRKRVAHASERLEPVGGTVSGSQIMPLIIGEDGATMRAAARLQSLGFDVRGIRPPTVPEGTSRLRISLTLNVDEHAIDALADALRPACV